MITPYVKKSDDFSAMLEDFGIVILGMFRIDSNDENHWAELHGRQGQWLHLIGNVGSRHFDIFQQKRAESHPKPLSMDEYSEAVLEDMFSSYQIEHYYFPSRKPYAPFQSWALRAHSGFLSPLGLLIHPLYGLWHAYRAVMITQYPLTKIEDDKSITSPCASCVEKPCISACPAKAVGDESAFSYQQCQAYLRAETTSFCVKQHCLSRQACPVGKKHQYHKAHLQFHQQNYVENVRG